MTQSRRSTEVLEGLFELFPFGSILPTEHEGLPDKTSNTNNDEIAIEDVAERIECRANETMMGKVQNTDGDKRGNQMNLGDEASVRGEGEKETQGGEGNGDGEFREFAMGSIQRLASLTSPLSCHSLCGACSSSPILLEPASHSQSVKATGQEQSTLPVLTSAVACGPLQHVGTAAAEDAAFSTATEATHAAERNQPEQLMQGPTLAECAAEAQVERETGVALELAAVRAYMARLEMDADAAEAEVRSMAAYLGMDPTEDADLLWIAVDAAAAPLPRYWRELHTPNGTPYYHCFRTRQTQACSNSASE